MKGGGRVGCPLGLLLKIPIKAGAFIEDAKCSSVVAKPQQGDTLGTSCMRNMHPAIEV